MRADTSELISPSGGSEAAPVARDRQPAVAVVAAARRFDLSRLPARTRADEVALTLESALRDERFRDCVTLADAARDRRDWVVAEAHYAIALRRFPLHWGYCIQHAHTIKEQHAHARAEIWYRSAVALGAPSDLVDQHLAFVARLNGVPFLRDGNARLDVPPMLAPPTVHDIRLLGELTRVPGMAGDDLVLHLLRNAATNRAVLLHMLAMPEFAHANRALLAIIAHDPAALP